MRHAALDVVGEALEVAAQRRRVCCALPNCYMPACPPTPRPRLDPLPTPLGHEKRKAPPDLDSDLASLAFRYLLPPLGRGQVCRRRQPGETTADGMDDYGCGCVGQLQHRRAGAERRRRLELSKQAAKVVLLPACFALCSIK